MDSDISLNEMFDYSLFYGFLIILQITFSASIIQQLGYWPKHIHMTISLQSAMAYTVAFEEKNSFQSIDSYLLLTKRTCTYLFITPLKTILTKIDSAIEIHLSRIQHTSSGTLFIYPLYSLSLLPHLR